MHLRDCPEATAKALGKVVALSQSPWALQGSAELGYFVLEDVGRRVHQTSVDRA